MRRSTMVVAWFWVGLGGLAVVVALITSAAARSLPQALISLGVWAIWLGLPTAFAVGLVKRAMWAWWGMVTWAAASTAYLLLGVWLMQVAGAMPSQVLPPALAARYPSPWVMPIVPAVSLLVLLFDPPRRWRRAPALQPAE